MKCLSRLIDSTVPALYVQKRSVNNVPVCSICCTYLQVRAILAVRAVYHVGAILAIGTIRHVRTMLAFFAVFAIAAECAVNTVRTIGALKFMVSITQGA